MKRALLFFSNTINAEAVRKKILPDAGKQRDLFGLLIEKSLKEIIKASEKIQFDIIISSENNFSSGPQFPQNNNPGIKFISQPGKTFGERFLNNINDIHKSGYNEFVIIGNDSPDLSAELIITAFEKLRESDTVIGPSTDGGFYLFGSNKFDADVFKNIPWLSSDVLFILKYNIEKLGLTYNLLTLLTDIDSHSDLINWMRTVNCDPAFAKLVYLVVFVNLKHVYYYEQHHIIKPQLLPQNWQIPPPLD
ncbi:MAG: hypothetical protein Kow0098_00570 [Ignavibacteriaceae bacterium]